MLHKIWFVSSQFSWLYLKIFQKFLHFFCGQKWRSRLFLWNILHRQMSINFILFLRTKISLPYKIKYSQNFLSCVNSERMKAFPIHTPSLFRVILILFFYLYIGLAGGFLPSDVWGNILYILSNSKPKQLFCYRNLWRCVCGFWRSIYLLYNKEFLLKDFMGSYREWRYTVVWLYLSFSPFLRTWTVHLSSFIQLLHRILETIQNICNSEIRKKKTTPI